MIYLGTIDNAGSDVKNNLTATTPFAIPRGKIVVQPSGATIQVASKATSDVAFLPATGNMASLVTANALVEVGYVPGGTIASRKTDAGAGTLKVFLVKAY